MTASSNRPTRQLGAVALVVDDYDRAIDWFTRCLGFMLTADEDRGGGKRWVTLLPAEGAGTALLIARAVSAEQASVIGRQGGGRVWLFLQTTRFDEDHARMVREGVEFCEQPRNEEYGKVVVFKDLMGNRWDLIQPADIGA